MTTTTAGADVHTRILDRMLSEGYANTLEYAEASADPRWGNSTDEQRLDLLHVHEAEIRQRYRDTGALLCPAFDETASTAVFLDIDGVVAPDPLQDPYRYELPDTATFLQPMVPVRLPVIDWLRRNHAARLLWASSWCSQALTLTEAVGGGPVESVIDERGTLSKKDSVTEYLLNHPEVIRAVICEDEPYIIDDPDVTATVHYIACDPHQGLTDADLTYLDALISR